MIKSDAYTNHDSGMPVAADEGLAIKTKQKPMNIINNGSIVFLLDSYFSFEVTVGNFETQKNTATAINKPANMRYASLIAVIFTWSAGNDLVALPNKIILITKGPNKVPKLFTPPARFKRLPPVSGVHNATTNGLAAVCCKEKPNAITKNEPKINRNEPELTAGIINNAPPAESTKP